MGRRNGHRRVADQPRSAEMTLRAATTPSTIKKVGSQAATTELLILRHTETVTP